MYREIRRKDRVLPEEEQRRILSRALYGILSTVGENGAPYGVPVSFVYQDDAVYFHCARAGHKLDNMAIESRVSFCVVDDVQTVPDQFTTKYKSVILFGKATEAMGQEKLDALMLLVQKYSADFMEAGKAKAQTAGGAARVFRIEVEHATAKGNV